MTIPRAVREPATARLPFSDAGPAERTTMAIRHTARSRVSAVSLITALALSGAVLAACGHDNAVAAASTNDDASTGNQASTAHHDDAGHQAGDQAARAALYATMRTLWHQHMEWTYATVVAFAADSPSLKPTIDRLLRNQADIGNAVAPLYGDKAAKSLTKLLTTHIEQAVPVLTAAKSGDKAALGKAVKDWYANARDIADFLATANPAWGRQEMRSMMKTHITQTIGYAGDVLNGRFAAAIAKYDKAEKHMAEMADMLSQGLITQFPGKF
ncbi:hypothetical protein [Sphaerimonospora thailandensis]|uniref:Glycosyltransferase n=1 Tax=Sphaerimonospora thailandensis TaxID=795644 RepID=A0A8J3W1B6_9ACTN|nr:hypothetical protein [Sphaerimonospora thailandensis]GIH73159.1 hypothetical protein Mth01_54120 [Sphaerimonospora thailandensis]